MECPICLEIMEPPIYQCNTGHSFCSTCKPKLSKCPTCTSPIGNSRNFALESMLDTVKFPCPNADLGCPDFQTRAGLKKHKSTCGYGGNDCPAKTLLHCNWNGQKSSLKDHVKAKHFLEESKKLTNGLLTDTIINDAVHFMYAFGNLFCVYRQLEHNVIYWGVQYLGKVEDAARYYYQIHVRMIPNATGKELRMFERCFNETLTFDEVVNKGLCIGVPLKSLKSYKSDGGCVWWDTEIYMK